MNVNINELIKFAKKMESIGRYDLADNIDLTLLNIKTASGSYEDEKEFMNLINSVGSEQDLEDHDFYTSIYGDEFPEDDSVMSKHELAKTLQLEKNSLYKDYGNLLLKTHLSTREEKDLQILSDKIKTIDADLQSIYSSIKKV